MNDPIVQGVGLGHVFGHGARSVRALDGVSVALHPGKTLGVIGESGSGKSTLGDILGGMLVPGEGEVFYKGRARAPLPNRLTPCLPVSTRRRASGLFLRCSNAWA